MRILKRGVLIHSLESWFELAPPAGGERQWKDNCSAKELARAFVGSGKPAIPEELAALLRSNEALGEVEIHEAFPEHIVALDSFGGNTRNADLAATGISVLGKAALTIEAKANESFGTSIAAAVKAAPPRSNVKRRIDGLCKALFGRSPGDCGSLQYQLLHGAAASLIFASEQRALAAVFAVLEFRSPASVPGKLARNARAFEAFVSAIAPTLGTPRVGKLIGPIKVPGGGKVPGNVPLFIGKTVKMLT